nr:hypothetical protein [uncultured Flavobacterium sp.]
MKKFKKEIRSKITEIISICEFHDIEYQEITLHTLAFEGAGSFTFFNEIQYEDLPENLGSKADDILDMFCEKFPDYEVGREEVMNEILSTIF